MMFDNILVYLDQNVIHDSLLECVINAATNHRANVTLIAVTRPLDERLEFGLSKDLLQTIHDDKNTHIQSLMDNFKQRVERAGIITQTVISEGKPVIEITRQVLKKGHNLVMMLANDLQTGLSKAFFGSIQMQLLRHCPCAVWIVKADSKPNAQQILAPVDIEFEDHEEATINHAIVAAASEIAQKDCKSLTFMHVWSLYGESYLSARGGLTKKDIKSLRKQRKRELKQKLTELVKQKDWRVGMVDIVLPRNKLPATEIVKAVQKNNIELLIMGTLCRTGLEGFFIGNTAEKILSEVSCSVLALKPTGFVSPIKP